MFGWGHGRWHGYGRGWGGWGGRRWWTTPPTVEGYTYVGPCRCGWGPHAFYRDPSGRIVHVSQIFSGSYSAAQELEALKKEKEELERRIRELEASLSRKEA